MNLGEARAAFQIVWLSDGRTFVLGGLGETEYCLSSVEMSMCKWNGDGETGGETWQPMKPMLTPRSHFAAVVLRNEAVLVAGGKTYDDELHKSVELFSPPASCDVRSLGQWTSLQPMVRAPGLCSGVSSAGVIFIVGVLSLQCSLLCT